MAIGRSFANIKGGVSLSEKMIATNWKGMLVLRDYPLEYNQARTRRQSIVVSNLSTFSGLYNRVLTVKGRAEWEALAKMLGSAYHQEKRMVMGRRNTIIQCNPGGVLMSGHDLFIRCNMLAAMSGFTHPRLRAPLITGLPPSPGILVSQVMLQNGEMGLLCRLRPPVLSNDPPDKVYRLWMRVQLRGIIMVHHLEAMVKIGGGMPNLEGVMPIEKDGPKPISHQMEQLIAMEEADKQMHTDGILLTGFEVSNKKMWGVERVPFSALDVATVLLQAEVVVADTSEHGAVRSAPSNLEEIVLPEQLDNPEAKRLSEIARICNRAKNKKRQAKNTAMKRFFLKAADMTKEEVVKKVIGS